MSPDVHIVEARLGSCGERAPAVVRQPFTLRNSALGPEQVERVEVHGLGWRVAGAEDERAALAERRRHATAHAEHRHLEEAGRRGRDGLPFTKPQLAGQAPPCGRTRRVGGEPRPAKGRLVEGAQDAKRVTEGIERVAVGGDERFARSAATHMEVLPRFERRRHGWGELQAAKGVRQAECRHVDRRRPRSADLRVIASVRQVGVATRPRNGPQREVGDDPPAVRHGDGVRALLEARRGRHQLEVHARPQAGQRVAPRGIDVGRPFGARDPHAGAGYCDTLGRSHRPDDGGGDPFRGKDVGDARRHRRRRSLLQVDVLSPLRDQ